MDYVTAVTIIASLVAVMTGAVAMFKIVKKPDESWKPPLSELEGRVAKYEREINDKLNVNTMRLTRVETHVEGIPELKNSLSKLDGKMDSLTRTIIQFFSNKSGQV
jgi:hypothetical protein